MKLIGFRYFWPSMTKDVRCLYIETKMSQDDVIQWKYIPRYFLVGIHRLSVGSAHKGQWRGALMFVWSAPEQTVEQTMELPVIWDAMVSMWRHCNVFHDISVTDCMANCHSWVILTNYDAGNNGNSTVSVQNRQTYYERHNDNVKHSL